MGFFDKVFNRKDEKAKVSQSTMERKYREIKHAIETYEEEKARCVKEAAKYAPDSFQYKDCERAYKKASDQLVLKYQELQSYVGLLDAADRQLLIQEHGKTIAELEQLAKNVLPDQNEMEKINEKTKLKEEKLQSQLSALQDISSSIFDQEIPQTVRADTGFSQAVAQEQRHNAQLQMAGIESSEIEPAAQKTPSAFDQAVSAQKQAPESEKKEE